MKINKTKKKIKKIIEVESEENIYNLELNAEQLCYLVALSGNTGDSSKLRDVLTEIYKNSHSLFHFDCVPTMTNGYTFFPPNGVYDSQVKVLLKNLK